MKHQKLIFGIALSITALFCAAALLGLRAKAAADLNNENWKGAETFSLIGAAPNVTRCGAFPENIELTFAGSGIDTEGGMFNVTASGCTNSATNRIFDLKATDSYVKSGDQVFIAAGEFVQVIDQETCVATNEHPVAFSVAGGTGGHAGATGQGRFNFAMNQTTCNGLVQPAHVWFKGMIRR